MVDKCSYIWYNISIMEDSQFTELEFKYKADDIGLKQFQELMENISYLNNKTISSWDYYFTNNSDDFIRFRASHDIPELTIKRKTRDTNNWKRVEIDLPLNPNQEIYQLKQIVNNFVALEGYKENFRIYKSCFVYWQEYVNYVYYIVYDEQMREKDRFLEIEFNKDKIEEFQNNQKQNSREVMPGTGTIITSKEISPFEYLKKKEQELSKLDLGPKNRMRKSLFELYRK